MIKEIIQYVMISQGDLFDREYYLQMYPEVRKAGVNPIWHYVHTGWKEGRNPSKKFNTNYYLLTNPDVKKSKTNPLFHYIIHGKKEGRSPLPTPQSKLVKHRIGSDEKTKHAILENPIRCNASNKNQNETLTFIFHIGDTKTGTSIIQNFLDVNRLNLYTFHNTLYPNMNSKQLEAGRCHNHGEWYEERIDNPNLFTKDLDYIVDFSLNNAINNVILSFEAWLLDETLLNLIKNYSHNHKQINFQIICYLRRIDHWCESAWKQWGLKMSKNIECFLTQPMVIDHYPLILTNLNAWSELIELENIIVRPYEKNQLSNGIIQDFIEHIGLDYRSHLWENAENHNQALNSGFNRDVIELLHYCKNLFSDVHDNHLFNMFAELLNGEFQKQPFEPYALLSPRQRYRLYQQNSEIQEIIAQKFMGRNNGKIFDEPPPHPDDSWQPYRGLDLHNALPIIIKLIDGLYIQKNNPNSKSPSNSESLFIDRLNTIMKYIKKLLRYIKQYFSIKRSGLFHWDYYLHHNPDVQESNTNPLWHYIKIGWKEGRNPSADFHTNFYLESNPDVKQTGINPLIHYIFFGQHENRPPIPTPPEAEWRRALEKRPWTKHIQQYPQGLNVIGFLQTAKGLAEVIRYNQHAYNSAGINYSLIDYEYSIPEHQQIIPIPDHEWVNEFRFNTNIFHINPPQLPYAWETFSAEALTGRYSIGVWYWELPELPDDWCFAFDLVDEVWVASDYVQEAISSKTHKPVIKIPPCIYLDEVPKITRGDFGLPENRFLFMCAYDVLSSQERKNPSGAIKAFKSAFPQNDPGVGLVIKVNNAQEQPLEISKIKDELAEYNNIYYVDEILDRDSLNALIKCIDVHVSLHRAEGFGLVPAEAMYLGKPVIMTKWSGNLELMTPNNACGVDYQLTKLQQDYGPYQKGQYWAEPDVDHAAVYMKILRGDPAYFNQISVKAQKLIHDKFSPKNIGAKILSRLQALGLHT